MNVAWMSSHTNMTFYCNKIKVNYRKAFYYYFLTFVYRYDRFVIDTYLSFIWLLFLTFFTVWL